MMTDHITAKYRIKGLPHIIIDDNNRVWREPFVDSRGNYRDWRVLVPMENKVNSRGKPYVYKCYRINGKKISFSYLNKNSYRYNYLIERDA